MAQSNRQRRGTREQRAAAAAWRQARRRAHAGSSTAGSSTAGAAPGGAGIGWERTARPEPSAETISTVLLSAAHDHRSGDQHAGAAIGAMLASRCADRPGVVEAAVRHAVMPLIAAAWARGWSPEALHQLGRRRLDAPAVGYLVDAIAAESQQYAQAAVHDRGADERRQSGAVVWGESGRGHLMEWAGRHGHSAADALMTVIEVLSLLLSLPVLPRILPPPGSAMAAQPRRGVDQKVLARVRGLLAKAESTTFPDEAEALSAKAQELMTRHCLERIVLDSAHSAAGSDPKPATARRLWRDSPYVAAKALLVGAVAQANRCRTVLSEKLGFTTVLGDEVDLEVVELLATALLVQATRAMVSAGSQITRTGQSRTRSYRQSFLIAYATRIGERLTTARDAGTAAAGADPARLLPVLAARERVVDELFESMFPQSVARSYSVGNAAGWHAGRAAADLAVLDTPRALAAADEHLPALPDRNLGTERSYLGPITAFCPQNASRVARALAPAVTTAGAVEYESADAETSTTTTYRKSAPTRPVLCIIASEPLVPQPCLIAQVAWGMPAGMPKYWSKPSAALCGASARAPSRRSRARWGS